MSNCGFCATAFIGNGEVEKTCIVCIDGMKIKECPNCGAPAQRWCWGSGASIGCSNFPHKCRTMGKSFFQGDCEGPTVRAKLKRGDEIIDPMFAAYAHWQMLLPGDGIRPFSTEHITTTIEHELEYLSYMPASDPSRAFARKITLRNLYVLGREKYSQQEDGDND